MRVTNVGVVTVVANHIIAIVPTADCASVCGCYCAALQSIINIDSGQLFVVFVACSQGVSIFMRKLLFSQDPIKCGCFDLALIPVKSPL